MFIRTPPAENTSSVSRGDRISQGDLHRMREKWSGAQSRCAHTAWEIATKSPLLPFTSPPASSSLNLFLFLRQFRYSYAALEGCTFQSGTIKEKTPHGKSAEISTFSVLVIRYSGYRRNYSEWTMEVSFPIVHFFG